VYHLFALLSGGAVAVFSPRNNFPCPIECGGDSRAGEKRAGREHHDVDFLALAYMAAQAMRKNTPVTMASMTGGEYELFARRKNFEARMIDFSNHVHSRYVLSIEPKSPHAGLHQIRVVLKKPGDRVVLARSRYWVTGGEK